MRNDLLWFGDVVGFLSGLVKVWRCEMEEVR